MGIPSAFGLAFPAWSVTGRMLYALASVALAALSIGHEYVYGTLPSLLTLPTTRGRILATKLSALVPMLLTLGFLAYVLLPPDPRFDRNVAQPGLLLLLAVSMASWLTLLCRSPLAGVALPGGLIACGALAADVLSPTVHQWAIWIAVAISVLGTWRAFMRLEAIDARGGNISLPHWFGGSTSPTWLLILKELHLQQMAFVVSSAFYLLGWVGFRLYWGNDPDVRDALAAVGFIYGALVAILTWPPGNSGP